MSLHGWFPFSFRRSSASAIGRPCTAPDTAHSAKAYSVNSPLQTPTRWSNFRKYVRRVPVSTIKLPLVTHSNSNARISSSDLYRSGLYCDALCGCSDLFLVLLICQSRTVVLRCLSLASQCCGQSLAHMGTARSAPRTVVLQIYHCTHRHKPRQDLNRCQYSTCGDSAVMTSAATQRESESGFTAVENVRQFTSTVPFVAISRQYGILATAQSK